MYIPVLLIESIFLIYFLFSSHPPILQKLGQEFVSNNCAISSFNSMNLDVLILIPISIGGVPLLL